MPGNFPARGAVVVLKLAQLFLLPKSGIAARLKASVRRIHIELCSAYALQGLFSLVHEAEHFRSCPLKLGIKAKPSAANQEPLQRGASPAGKFYL